MKDSKTTIIGAILAALVVIEPLLSGVGYHIDRATGIRLLIAGSIAALSYYAKDKDGAK